VRSLAGPSVQMIFVLRIAPQNRVCPTKCQGAFFKDRAELLAKKPRPSPTPASGKKR
jgi:hypothetical protein